MLDCLTCSLSSTPWTIMHFPQAAMAPSLRANFFASSAMGNWAESPSYRSTPAPLRKSVTSSPALSKKLPKRTAFHLISGTFLALREDSPWEGNVQPERQQRLCPLCFALGSSEPVRLTTLGECAGSARAAFPACRCHMQSRLVRAGLCEGRRRRGDLRPVGIVAAAASRA